MFRRLLPCLGTWALALAAFFVLVEPASAQWRGGRGGYYYGNSGWYGGRGGYYSGSYAPWYGGYIGIGSYGVGYSPYYPQYEGGRYGRADYRYDTELGTDGPLNSYRDGARISAYPPEVENNVVITLRVSPGAQVWIDGAKTTQTGGVRLFSSPPIDADREYSYEIRARWTEGGQEVDRSRKVSFHAGDRLAVNMMKRSSQDADASPKHETLTPALPRADEGGRPASRAQDLRRLPTAPTERKPVEAADKNAHDGKVISITEDKLVMTGMDEKEHTHALTADVKMTCDKQVCKWDGIKAGMKIRVTTKKDDSHTVTTIEALGKRVNFEKLGTF